MVHQAPCRVLVVEDNDDGREFMQALLEFEGHLVESVATVHDAMARLAGEGGSAPYDVLLTDIGLPDGSGWEIVAHARARWPRLKIGVVTGWELRTGVTNGADFTLRKPVRTQDLLARITGSV
jgi:DNA-binding response OmpR family regulator